MNQLITIGPGAPPACDRKLRMTVHHLISGAHLSAGKLTLLPGRAIGPELRASLEARLAVVGRSLDHRDELAVTERLSDFFQGFTSLRDDFERGASRLRVYLDALSDLPAWAVVKAIDQLARPSDGKRHEFPPSEATVHSFAFQHCRLWIEERAELHTLLGVDLPPEPTDAETSRVGALVGDLAATLRMDAASRSLEEQRIETERRDRARREEADRMRRVGEDTAARRAAGESGGAADPLVVEIVAGLSEGLRRTRDEANDSPAAETIAAAVATRLRAAGWCASDPAAAGHKPAPLQAEVSH